MIQSGLEARMKPITYIANLSIVRAYQLRARLCLALALLLAASAIAPIQAADGPAALVKDIFSGATGSNPQHLTDVNGILFFVADGGVHGQELWKSDGTAAGTMLVKDISPGATSSQAAELTSVNGTLFFRAVADGTTDYELWKSDGTAAGTMLVKDIYPGSLGSAPWYLTDVNGTLFFVASDGSNAGLWKSDGTAVGTVFVKKVSPFAGYPNIANDNPLKNVDGKLFFATGNAGDGASLWTSDGTPHGTFLLRDFPQVPGWPHFPPPPSLVGLVNVSGTLVFDAYDGSSMKLWKSDGTAQGTFILANIDARERAILDGILYFLTYTPDTSGNSVGELWKSDGTTAGTKSIVRFAGAEYTSPYALTSGKGVLFFVLYKGPNHRELWKSDGTAAGTVFVKDIGYTAGDVIKPSIAQARSDGRMLIAAKDGEAVALWESNGTELGTVRLQTLPPAVPDYSLPRLVAAGSNVFFVVEDPSAGAEPWALDADALSAPVANDTMLIVKAGAIITGTLDAVDLEGDALTFRLVTNGGKGVATIIDSATGAFTYTPNPNASAADQFTFQATDGTHESRVATVTVYMTPEIEYLPAVYR
jgi:ELWxxDGT repeat protein